AEVGADGTPARFRLAPEGVPVLSREEDSLVFAGGAFSGAPVPPDVVAGLVDAFRTGRGLTYDRLGPVCAHQTERMLGPWARRARVPCIVPALDGVAAKLEPWAEVIDVGCGAGAALIALAGAYPASRFTGY